MSNRKTALVTLETHKVLSLLSTLEGKSITEIITSAVWVYARHKGWLDAIKKTLNLQPAKEE